MSNVVECKQFNEGADVAWLQPEQPASPNAVEASELSGAEVARLWGVTLRTLRYYESRGLISPRRDGSVRAYSQMDNRRIGLVLRAKKLGFTLAEISQMTDVKDGGSSPRGLQLTAKKCLQQISHLESRLKSNIEAIAELRRIHLALCCEAGKAADDRS
jgi:DNA-binding transcriptional MerR regulator